MLGGIGFKNYHYIGGNDLNGRMWIYKSEMKEYNLSTQAIKDFAESIKFGNLENLKAEFEQLSDKQKDGLLRTGFDHNDLFGGPDFMNLDAPFGSAISLANHFKHPEIAAFLEAEKARLNQINFY